MKVSVIMPNYNCSPYISLSIESVIAQTFSDWELLIIDDFSNDGSYEIALKYAEKDSRIIVLRNEKNSGAAFSRNRGMENAKGDYIAFLDSDDLWDHKKLEKQISFMETNAYDFSYTLYERINTAGVSLNTIVSGPVQVTPKMLFRSNYLGCLTVMFNAKKLGKFFIRDDIYKRNDHAIWLKVIKMTNCYLLTENLAKYRVRENSMSKTSLFKMLCFHYQLYRKSESKNVFSSLFYITENLFFGFLRKRKYTRKIIEEVR